MSHDNHDSHGSDRSAAFVGLIIGAIVIFGIMRTIVSVTNAKYNGEKSAVETTK